MLSKMPFISVKKHYLLSGLLIFVVLFIFNNRPVFQCQIVTEDMTNIPFIYAITPTYTRLAQKADLTRLSQTLLLVKNFHWIIVEDSAEKTKLVKNLLKDSSLKYTHLNVKTPKIKHSSASGVEQRNLGLSWLRAHLAAAPDARGVLYFMDDDNTYSYQLFDEMRRVVRVGVWPVGLVGGMRVERPLVKGGRVVGFNALWKPSRPFPIDMAGFAINTTLLLRHPEAKFSRRVQSGYQESEILKYFTNVSALEPLAQECSRVLVWHTRTQRLALLKGGPAPGDADIEV